MAKEVRPEVPQPKLVALIAGEIHLRMRLLLLPTLW
jgi:hypothetical protein